MTTTIHGYGEPYHPDRHPLAPDNAATDWTPEVEAEFARKVIDRLQDEFHAYDRSPVVLEQPFDRAALEGFIRVIGIGFHADTPVEDYGLPAVEAANLEAALLACESAGQDANEIALEMLGLNPVASSEREHAALCDEYKTWNKANGLNLGSADEHTFDETLTPAQLAWVRDFSQRWEDASIAYTHAGPAGVFKLDLSGDLDADAECPHCGSRNTAPIFGGDGKEQECHDCGKSYDDE